MWFDCEWLCDAVWVVVVCVCVCLRHVCVLFVMYKDVGWFGAVCDCVCLCLCVVFV